MNDTASCMLFGWQNKKRWKEVTRPYSPEDVLRLRGSLKIEYTISAVGSNQLWNLLGRSQNNSEIQSVEEAIQQVGNGLPFVHLSSRTSIILLVRDVSEAFRKADQTEPGKWRVPIVANVGTEFSGIPMHMFEAARELVGLGASGICLDHSEKLREKLVASRLAADVCGVPMVLVTRLDDKSMHDKFRHYCDFVWTTEKAGNTPIIHPPWFDEAYRKNVNEVLNQALS